MFKLTKEQQKQVMNEELEIEADQAQYLHCDHCLKDYMNEDLKFGSGLSPKEAITYQAVSTPYKYPNGKVAGVVAVVCNRCDRVVWNTRHLTNLF